MTTSDAFTSENQTLPLPPGKFGLPGLGESLTYLLDPNFVEERQAKYGPIFKTHLFGHPTVIMIGADANRFILADEMSRFSWYEGWPSSVKNILADSLVVQEGAEHARNRKALM